jgi:predicted CXXCH cytochrome family protein
MRKILCGTILIWFVAASAFAGNWHSAGSLRCADCHLQHSSSQPGSGPFSYLLVKNSVNEVCLSCHDGQDPAAPDVQAPVTMYNSTSSLESAAGFFGLLGIQNANGHSLGMIVPTPLQSTTMSVELNCASCHAVHGNGNYRNLLEDPTGTGVTLRVETGLDVFVNQIPSDPPSVASTAATYERNNSAYVSGMTQWCASCHDMLSLNNLGASPAHFNGHPSDVSLNQYGSAAHTDPLHWTSGLGEGFPDAGNAGIPRVPFLAPQATSFSAAKTPTESDHVSCLSCHKAHGSSNQKGMLWPYFEGGPTYVSGCQQCHNK